MVGGEVSAGPAEATSHLVGNEQCAGAGYMRCALA
jgi:hypothetical protein